MKKYVTILLFLFISCTHNLNENFRETMIEYQKKFPVPPEANNSKSTKKYIYEAVFSKSDGDTLLTLTRTYSKVDGAFYGGYEIMQDTELKPFVIIDVFNVSGDLVHKKPKEKVHSWWDAGEDYDEYYAKQYTPLYRYKIKNKKIHLLEKDIIFEKIRPFLKND